MAWQVDRDLYVSSRPRSADQLTRLGARALVSVNYRVPNDQVLGDLRSLGVEWLHFPMPDGKTVQVLAAVDATQAVRNLLKRGFTTVVHCDAGRNRSCLVAALVLRDRYGLTGQQAADLVRERRPRAYGNQATYDWLCLLDRPG